MVPTLHTLFFEPIKSTLIPRVYPDTSCTATLRDELIAWIAEEGLGGDRLAAEWLLLCSIARV
jgi:hypothetical protein